MNPAQISELLNSNDIIFLLKILYEREGSKSVIAENIGIERKTLYNFRESKEILKSTKKKIIYYLIKNYSSEIYELLKKKLSFKLSEVIIEIWTRNIEIIRNSGDQEEKQEFFLNIWNEIGRYHSILSIQVPERYQSILEELSYLRSQLLLDRIQFDQKIAGMQNYSENSSENATVIDPIIANSAGTPPTILTNQELYKNPNQLTQINFPTNETNQQPIQGDTWP
ncbi:MAG: hypothetical protein ACFFCS_00360 [Candidatus Hodarchaeota archaeon]